MAIPKDHAINQNDADVLVSAYWKRYYGGCGLAYPVHDAGQVWAARMVRGYFAVRKPDIVVDKTTGYISHAGGPTVTNWAELYK